MKKGPVSFTTKLIKAFTRSNSKKKYIVEDIISQKLYHVEDKNGPIYFELTEVEGGGTVIKVSYKISIKTQMVKLKTNLHLKIPATPIGNRCPSCGKPTLPEFNLCPYCDEKFIKD